MSQRSSGPVKVGVIGTGSFGRLHALTLSGIAEAELVALVDPDRDRLTKLSREIGTVRAWSDIDEAIASSDAEAWVVVTRTDSHVDLAERLLRAGKSVLIEKPMATSVAQAERLAPLIHPASANLMLGHILLFAAEFRQLFREAAARGPIHYLQAVRHRSTATADVYAEETPLRLLMVHDLYQALALMPDDEPTRLRARHRHTRSGRADVTVAEIEWPNGALACFTASFLTPPGMPSDGFDRLEIFGEDWAAKIDLNPRPLQLWDKEARWPLGLDIVADAVAPSGWLADELRHFCRVVRGIEPVVRGARYDDGLRVQRWLEQLEQSAAQTEREHA